MIKRGKYLPKLSARDKARWAWSLAGGGDKVTDAHLEHTGATRADIDALVDELVDSGDLVKLGAVGSDTYRITPRHRPPVKRPKTPMPEEQRRASRPYELSRPHLPTAR
jgi:hypothetical protein